MDLKRGDVVRSLAGHDKGALFCVVDTEGDFLLLADGKERKLNSPKRKRRKHAQRAGLSDHPVFLRLRAGEPVGDSEVRRALAAFRDERNQQQSRRE
ncbi:MAG: hypothetical protein ACI4O5_01730 [Oscillospiraceae bacterium]